MLNAQALNNELERIDSRGYKAYKEIQGAWDFGPYQLYVDYVQGDPYANPSEVRARVDAVQCGFPTALHDTPVRRRALEDYLARAIQRAIGRYATGYRGSGKSGLIAIDAGGQEVLKRTAVVVSDEWVEARMVMGLPARGRTVLGHQAREMFFDELPPILKHGLVYEELDGEELRAHVNAIEDQDAIRDQLPEMGLVCFVANGSMLPRESGVSDRPMRGHRVVPFESPKDLEVSISAPHAGEIRGMGVPEGVTLIVGGGYHGKSTLLEAISRGVYDHIPGDGRERVVTAADAVKIRAEDGRRVSGVDISSFISELPGGVDTTEFSTENASGSTSQAANIAEALETGATTLLLDEDTSATNFMIRDARMQRLVESSKEPITPFIDRVCEMYEALGVSTILVMGGAGDYFDVADTVIVMDHYRPRHETRRAKEIAEKLSTARRFESSEPLHRPRARCPLPESLDPSRGKRDVRIRTSGLDAISFGTDDIDISAVDQIVDSGQTRAIGDALNYARENYMDAEMTVAEIIDAVLADVEEQGLKVLDPIRGRIGGDYALPRKHEIAAALNRLHTLRVTRSG